MKKTVLFTLAVLMISSTCFLTTGCRSNTRSRTIFQGDHNVTIVKKKKRAKVKGRKRPISGGSSIRVRN